jgi:hypothetical protein
VGDDYEAARNVLRQRHTAAIPEAATEELALIYGVMAHAERTDPASLLAALTVLRHLREELASWEPRLITAARRHGASWASLAPALGVTSRQAAERRYLRIRPSISGEDTGEGRVRAERDKRAGDRAVEAWARRNSTILRQLAGQVSALDGLSESAQHQADLVGQALADNDPATLLTPLANTHTYLRASHSELAERIESVTKRSEQLRRDTHEQRATGKSH